MSHYFFTCCTYIVNSRDKKSAEIYKQVQDTLDTKIQEKVKESFKMGYSNLVEVNKIRTDIEQ